MIIAYIVETINVSELLGSFSMNIYFAHIFIFINTFFSKDIYRIFCKKLIAVTFAHHISLSTHFK